MKISPNNNPVINFILSLLLFFTIGTIYAQNGTYELKKKNGSYRYISFQKEGNRVTAEIFAWWNTASAQTGSYYGTAISTANKFILQARKMIPAVRLP